MICVALTIAKSQDTDNLAKRVFFQWLKIGDKLKFVWLGYILDKYSLLLYVVASCHSQIWNAESKILHFIP